MTKIKNPLPEEVSVLQAMVLELTERDNAKAARIAELEKETARLEGLISARGSESAQGGCPMRRRKSLGQLRRVVQIHEPELPPCPEGMELVQVGVDTDERLGFDSTGFFALEIHRPKYVFEEIEVTITDPDLASRAGDGLAAAMAEFRKDSAINTKKRPRR